MQATKKMLLCAAVHFFLPFLLHWCVRVSLDGNRNSSIDLNFKSPKGRKRSGNNGERKDRPAAAATVNYHSSVDVVVSLKVAAWRTTNLSSQLNSFVGWTRKEKISRRLTHSLTRITLILIPSVFCVLNRMLLWSDSSHSPFVTLSFIVCNTLYSFCPLLFRRNLGRLAITIMDITFRGLHECWS